MSIIFKNDDFILKIINNSIKTTSIINKYDSFLDAFTSTNYIHVREAIKKAILFFVSEEFIDTKTTAIYTFNISEKLKLKYKNVDEYLDHIRIKNIKSYSIDLATGTGKSWVIYGVAQIMLAEGFVDKVLVLCPSITIEEELKKKFEAFSGNKILSTILQELGVTYYSPSIKSANDPILEGDICVENIHAAYQRTGSSIEDSFKGKGERTLVISDEAHHIFSDLDADTKKWFGFVNNDEYKFKYHLGLSGTPYIGDEYFHDVIYRYGINQAMEDGIVKLIDYKVDEESTFDKGFDETYHNHLDIQQKYLGILKPITIIITEKIITCIQVWYELVKYISDKECIPYEQAIKKIIWVTSGLPSNKNEKVIIESILDQPEKIRKDNLFLLKTVDTLENPVEWIVSVSMLTEGWDVKNVFQIVPHEQRAFNSKLLISQVLGRGLRIPENLEHPVLLKINNHESWTPNIQNLYNEVLEIENRLSWGFDEMNSIHSFPLYNLEYTSIQDVIEIKKKTASMSEKIKFFPQSKNWQETSEYSESGTIKFSVDLKDNISIPQAAREIKLFLKDKDILLSQKWPIKRIIDLIKTNLEECGQDSSYISRKNLTRVKQEFGPLLRDLGRETPRMKMKPNAVFELSICSMNNQYFNESMLKNNGYLFYCKNSINSLQQEQKMLLTDLLADKKDYESVKRNLIKYGGDENDIIFLKENLIEIQNNNFKTPLNLFFVSYSPELEFTKSLFYNIDLFDSVFKSPDKGFYSFPYSYKPDEIASTHVKRENFNPDFFLKIRMTNKILVVEIKSDGDTRQKNKAKMRDGKHHFENLNSNLKESGIDWEYYFYFLSPGDITDFFQAIKENRYPNWKSTLMQELS